MEIVRKMREGNTTEANEQETSTTRGLEWLGSYLYQRRATIKSRVTRAVLREQRHQRAMQVLDPHRLSSASLENSCWSLTLARSQGTSDATVYHELVKDFQMDSQYLRLGEIVKSSDQKESLPYISVTSCTPTGSTPTEVDALFSYFCGINEAFLDSCTSCSFQPPRFTAKSLFGLITS